jgi:hypothetical protein
MKPEVFEPDLREIVECKNCDDLEFEVIARGTWSENLTTGEWLCPECWADMVYA